MKKKHIYLILCIFWMAVIFWFSAQVADESQEMSDFFVYILKPFLFVGLSEDTASFIVRKAAHMSEYAVLAILLGLCYEAYGKKKWLLYALITTSFYAATDEFHQLFVAGRSGQIKDVLIDTIGACIGLLVLYFMFKIWQKKEMRRKM
ncbi:MAG: VanZ family protein [Clostridium sp.]